MRYYFYFLLLLFPLLHFGQSENCDQFRTGKFKIIDKQYGNSYILRKKNVQYEYSEKTKSFVKLKVKWINDCIYTLTLKKVIANPSAIDYDSNEGAIIVKMIELSNTGYLQQSSMEGYDLMLESEVLKIEEGEELPFTSKYWK